MELVVLKEGFNSFDKALLCGLNRGAGEGGREGQYRVQTVVKVEHTGSQQNYLMSSSPY